MENKILGKVLRNIDEMQLDAKEVKMFLAILVRANDYDYCNTTNKAFAEHLKMSERRVSEWIAKLAEKNLIKVIQNKHRHERRIYIEYPGKMQKYEAPETQDLTEEQRKFHEAFPCREIDCDVPDDVDMDALIREIKSTRLRDYHNMSLKSCCIKHYKVIMAGGYRENKASEPGQLAQAAKRLGVL